MTDSSSGARPDRPWPGSGLGITVDLCAGGQRARMVVVGELDIATAPILLRAFTSLVEDGYRHVEVDLAGVPFCDVAGWRALVTGQRDFQSLRGQLLVRRPCWSLSRLHELLGRPAEELLGR